MIRYNFNFKATFILACRKFSVNSSCIKSARSKDNSLDRAALHVKSKYLTIYVYKIVTLDLSCMLRLDLYCV